MKTVRLVIGIAILALLKLSAQAQITPPGISAYEWNGSAWAAASTSATAGAISYVPPAAALYCYNSGTNRWVPADSSCFGGGGGTGTVTSVALTGSANLFSSTPGTAVTTSGTLNADAQLLAQAANCVLAGPTTGAAAAPTCRAVVNADFPGTLAPTFSGANLTSLPAAAAGTLTGATLAAGVTASSLTSLGGGTVGTAAFVATGTSGATIPLLNGVNTYSGASTFSAAITDSVAGASSASAFNLTGTPFVGSGTTSTPLLYLNGGTAPTTWNSTASGGTYIGVNGISGFAGNFLDFHTNGGTSVFSVASTGGITMAAGGVLLGTAHQFGASGAILARTGSGGIITWANSGAYNGTVDLAISRSTTNTLAIGTGVAGNTGASISALGIIGGSFQQQAASNTGGTCAMSAGTSCTITIGHTYTTPVCIATQQSATLTGGAVGCTVSGTTVTITSAVLNSETWGAFVFGNPN